MSGNQEQEKGWSLRKEKTPYFISPVEFDDFEQKILDSLLEKTCQNPALEFKRCLREVCEEKNLVLEKTAGEKICLYARQNVEGLGFLEELLSDDELEEISIVGVGKPVFVYHRRKGWLETNASFTSGEHAVNAVNKMARPLGRRITSQHPRLNAVLPDGSRLHASIAPVALSGFEITIRKFKRNPFSASELARNGTISADALAFLWLVLYGDASLCVCGNTGSGKTTTLNALFSFIPLNERIVVTEETPELHFLQEHLVKIVSNEELGIGMRDLVKDTLRMRPDRVVVGEVRNADEARALFDSLLAGQAKGSYFTFHAKSACEALTRLKALGAGGEELDSLDLIVVQKRFSVLDKSSHAARDVRKVTEIAEVDNGRALNLFSYSNGRLEARKILRKSSLVEKVLGNYDFTAREFWAEFEKRKHFLEKGGFRDFRDFTLQAQRLAFGGASAE